MRLIRSGGRSSGKVAEPKWRGSGGEVARPPDRPVLTETKIPQKTAIFGGVGASRHLGNPFRVSLSGGGRAPTGAVKVTGRSGGSEVAEVAESATRLASSACPLGPDHLRIVREQAGTVMADAS
jgi:hypothetical protein